MRFRSHQHLRRTRDFQTVRAKGRRIQCGVFLFTAAPQAEETGMPPAPRLGVITSRRVGPAVVRNRLRRLVREIFRAHQVELRPDVDIVLVMRPGAARLTYPELEACFLNGARRSGALLPVSEPGGRKSGE